MPKWTLCLQTEVWVWVMLVNPLTKRLLEILWGFFVQKAIKEDGNLFQQTFRKNMICLSSFSVFVISRFICLQLDSSDLAELSDTYSVPYLKNVTCTV
jgi:hypothetical protein